VTQKDFPGELPLADLLYATQLEQQCAATLAFDVEPPGWLQLSLLSAAQLPTSAATVQPARQDTESVSDCSKADTEKENMPWCHRCKADQFLLQWHHAQSKIAAIAMLDNLSGMGRCMFRIWLCYNQVILLH